MHRTGISWVPLVGSARGRGGVSVASALAAPSAARPFELVAIDRYVGNAPTVFPYPYATFMSLRPSASRGPSTMSRRPPEQPVTVTGATGAEMQRQLDAGRARRRASAFGANGPSSRIRSLRRLRGTELSQRAAQPKPCVVYRLQCGDSLITSPSRRASRSRACVRPRSTAFTARTRSGCLRCDDGEDIVRTRPRRSRAGDLLRSPRLLLEHQAGSTDPCAVSITLGSSGRVQRRSVRLCLPA